MRTFGWRKNVIPVTLSGGWLDLSVMPGIPPPQFYATTPLNAATLTGVPGSDGLPIGGSIGGTDKRFVHELLINTSSANGAACPLLMVDLLMYYPFCDQGVAGEQAMVNSVTLPRYTTGEGVQIMAVLVFPQTGLGDTFVVSYTNSDGVAGRTTQLVTCNTMTYLGGIMSSASTGVIAGRFGAFLPLQAGDSGVRSIESVTMTNGTDVGVFTLVLVRPIGAYNSREFTAPNEYTCLKDLGYMPEFFDGACLSLLAQPENSLTVVSLYGLLTTSWG